MEKKKIGKKSVRNLKKRLLKRFPFIYIYYIAGYIYIYTYITSIYTYEFKPLLVINNGSGGVGGGEGANELILLFVARIRFVGVEL